MSLVPAVIGKAVARNALLLEKSSPNLLFGVGLAGMIGSTVLACRATLKMEEVLGEAKGKLDTAKDLEHENYSENDRGRDMYLIYVQTSVKIVRAYTPALVVGGLSVVFLTKSHVMLTRRNAALTAAYAALERGFAEYRARVVEKYGEEEDRNLRYAAHTVTTGEGKTKNRELKAGVIGPSIYARWFNADSSSWNSDPNVNYFFLKCQQDWANDQLKARGHLFLNEVYDMLGMPRSTAGSVVGWVLGAGDDYVNFGVLMDNDMCIVDFFYADDEILLDFNVDGVIYDKIEKGVVKDGD
jgi:Family of unknown function (DUF6353)